MTSKTNRCDVLCDAKEHHDHQAITSDTVLQANDTQLQETTTRPNISYMRLAAMAIDASPDGCCTALDIYAYVETTFPFYARTPPRYWKVSRHQSCVCVRRARVVTRPCLSAELCAAQPVDERLLCSCRKHVATESIDPRPGAAWAPQQGKDTAR